MQNSRDIINTIKERGLNVSEISRKTGIPNTRIYKWLDGIGNPKEEDAQKLRLWASQELELFPNSIDSQVNETGVKYIKKQPSDHDKYVALLESTNRTLEKAIQLSLNAVLENQLLMKARLNTTAEDIQDLLVDNGRKIEDVKQKTNIRMAEHLQALTKTGIAVGIPDKG